MPFLIGTNPKAYQQHFNDNVRFSTQLTICLAITLYLAFGFLDLWLYSKAFWTVLMIRIFVAIFLGLILGMSFLRSFKNNLQWWMSGVALVAGMGLVAMTAVAHATDLALIFGYSGLGLVLMGTYTLIKLSPKYAISVSLTLTVSYCIVIFFRTFNNPNLLGLSTVGNLVNTVLFLVGVNTIGITAILLMDYLCKRDFEKTNHIKDMYELLEINENRNKQLVDQIHDAIFIYWQDQILFVNSKLLELTGYTETELSRMTIWQIFHDDEKERLNSLKGGDFQTINDVRICTKNKLERSVDFSRSHIVYEGQRAFIGTLRDITDKKQLQATMMAQSKLATLGEIATGVAHEINQPLTYISTFIQNLDRRIKAGKVLDLEEIKEHIINGKHQLSRIEAIINHLRTFGRKNNMIFQPVSINEILNNTLMLLGERMRHRNIQLFKEIPDQLPTIQGNENQLEQVFINLIQNSMDAFPNQSSTNTITIQITPVIAKNQLIIVLADNGDGIKSTNITKIFEPFFTTKDIGKGTGLGLSIVYGIIRDHNGTIRCSSQEGRGTCFHIILPLQTLNQSPLTATDSTSNLGEPKLP